MRATLLAMLLIGCGSSDPTPIAQAEPPAPAPAPARPVPPPQAHKKITVPAFAFRAGDTLETIEHDDVTTKPGGSLEVKITTDRSRRIEVLAVAGDTITKARITYTKDHVETIIDGKPVPDYTLVGSPFLVTWIGGKPAIAREDRTSLTSEQSRRLLDDIRGYIGHADYVAKAVASAPFDVGTARPLADKQLARALGEIATVRHSVLRLLAARGDVAQLEQVIVFDGEEDGSHYRATTRNVIDLSIAKGQRIKQTSAMTLHFDRFDFDLQSTLRYRYITPGR